MRPHGLLSFVILAAALQAVDEEDTKVELQLKIDVQYSKAATTCTSTLLGPITLKCDLIHPEIFRYVPLAPEVQWFYRKSSRDPYVSLHDVPEDMFQGTPKGQTCSRVYSNESNYYSCKQVIEKTCEPKFDGQYQCKIKFESYNGSYNVYNDSQYLVGNSHADAGGADCFIPEVTSLRAWLNENHSIILDWDTTTIPPNQMYCDRSRRFSIRVVTYDNFHKYELKRTSFISSFMNTTKRRETNFTLPLSAQYTLEKFYVFQIRNQYLRGRIEDGPVLESTAVHNSDVFYFGDQELPKLVQPRQQVEKISVLKGNLVQLRCEAVGFPEPTTTMWFENTLIEPVRSFIKVRSVTRDILAESSSAGRYECSTVGHYLSPEGGAFFRSEVKYIDLEVYEEDSSSLLCTSPSAYSNCSRFLKTHSVLLSQDINFDDSINQIISSLDAAAHKLSGVEASCLDAAQAVVCHSSYPFCFNHSSSRKVCKTACDLFRNGGACVGVIDPQVYPVAHRIILSNCDNRTDSAGDYPECIHVPFGDGEANVEPSWCSVGRGVGYAGSVHSTTSGALCQDWSLQSPHKHAVYSGEDLHYAIRQCRNPQGRGTRPWCYTATPGLRWEYCDDVPQCEICTRYTETFCKELAGYNESGLVYLNRHESEWSRRGLDGAELWMNKEWFKLGVTGSNLSDSCLLGLKELICHKTVPLCSTSSQGATVSSMKLCSDHCKASMLLSVCPGNLVSKIEADMQSEGVTFSQLDCSMDTKSNSGTCLSSQAFLLATTNLVAEDDMCYEVADHGRTYNGTVATTRSGKTCQSWGSLLPGAKNYCRNPGPLLSSPWCYVNGMIWEYCDIPICRKTVITEPVVSTEVARISGLAIALVVFFIILGLVVILVGVSIAIFVYCRWKKKIQKRGVRKMTTVSSNWDYVRNENYHQMEDGRTPTKTSKLRKAIESFPQYEKDAIHYVRQIGQGNFGIVFYAKAEGVLPDEKVTEVAVKTLKEESCTEALEDFVREAKLMFSFDHENIVKIFGVAMESAPYYLIFEYMDKGDLAHFLRSNASSAQRRLMAPFNNRSRSRTESTLSNEPPSLSPEQLTDICKQIACGMKYLAQENHIHRDLACRNCLVKSGDSELTESGLVIKIGDFGMSHNLYSADYYRVKGSAILPVRWMSPEAIIYGKFSTESDVWSFGVVMWEVFSFAMQPYYGTSNEEVTEAIRRHKILKQPADCSSSMYDIMKQCWNQQPRFRPSFAELYKELDEYRASISSGGSPSIDYYNSNDSELDSDAFLEENSIDEVDAVL